MSAQQEKNQQSANITKQEKKKAPWVRLASAYYQFDLGEHPKLATPELYSFDPALDELIEEHLLDYSLPIIPCIDGHNIMTTNGVPSFLDTEIKVPLSPNFVRDLAGRTIYTGYGPEQKRGDQWVNNRHVTFPRHCRVVTSAIEGHEYIENIFFTRFRTLDTSLFYENPAHLKTLSYESENLYPYKLRLDTFYQDGWRLPQTNMLYARNDVDVKQAKNIGLKFIEEWEKVNSYASYEEFVEQKGGETWLEKLFQAGCTVIPNKEAFNSYYEVNSDYSIERRRHGRAVEALHDIVSEKASYEPKGTILEVIQPGFITATEIVPSKVIVSDGNRFKSELKAFPAPMFPDLRLPHQRTQSIWKATWLPTHPSHFSAPAIWGWDMATGHFMQFSGPLWDPLHYYYECTPEVVRAFKDHDNQSKLIAHVPHKMKERFYPISNIKGFDMISYNIKKMREENGMLPKSAVLRIHDDKPSSNIGYHPLPLAYEYELLEGWFPELLPNKRTPQKLENINLAPVIYCNIQAKKYINNAPDQNEYEKLNHPYFLKDATGNPLQDYPQLNRYLTKFTPKLATAYGKTFINIPESTLEDTSDIYLGDIDELIEATQIPFYSAVKSFRVKAINNLNKLIHNYNGDYATYIIEQWKGRE